MIDDELLPHDVTVVRASRTPDRYNNQVLDWSAPAEAATRGFYQPAPAAELTVDRTGVVFDAVLFLRPDVDVTALDRISADGRLHDVVGAPVPASDLDGPHHLELRLRAVEG